MKKLLLCVMCIFIISGCKIIHGAFLAHVVTTDSGARSTYYLPFSSMEECRKSLAGVNQYGATGGDAQSISSFVCVESCETSSSTCRSYEDNIK